VSQPVCAFTIDVEGFAESHAQSVTVDPALLNPDAMDREIAANLDVALELLARHQTRATFFFLGRIARSAPHLVRQVAEAGHEIGCHSLNHIRIFGQTREEFRRDLRTAKTALEDAGGQAVAGFRAPDFSIGRRNLWAFDELAEAGFRYDSSVVTTRVHDVYGITGVPDTPFQWSNGLMEFPLPVFGLSGFTLPLGGGGYFRLLPVGWVRRFYRSRTRRNIPTAFYIHPYEIGPVAPRIEGLSFVRRFRHYVRLSQGVERLTQLLASVPFTTMSRVLADCANLPTQTVRS
jgi:polysaccharide deacetylase family protein (PEP-CTERM system associated)